MKVTEKENLAKNYFYDILPHLGPVKSFIEWRLRSKDYHDFRIGIYTSEDILEEAILNAYQNLDHKPPGMATNAWLYEITNKTLDKYRETANS